MNNLAIYDTIKRSKEEGIKIGENRGTQTLNELRTAACKRAEKEIEEEYCRKEKRWIKHEYLRMS